MTLMKADQEPKAQLGKGETTIPNNISIIYIYMVRPPPPFQNSWIRP